MKTPTLLSEIESAIYLKMTPALLRYFTRRSVKSGENRKLACVERDGLRWYNRAELDSFNTYLHAPWPKKPGAQRPHLPGKIKEEIMLEAAAACPVCGHEASGEVAHIEPVAKTMSHHPGGLIWLCPNHHTVVDKVVIAHNVGMGTVRVLKGVLVDRRLRVLNLERAASSGFLQLIRQIEKLSAMIDNAALSEAKQGLEAMASVDFKALGESADKLVAAETNTKKDKKSAPLHVLASSVARTAKNVRQSTPGALAAFVATTASARVRYLDETGQVDCPVCNGRGTRNGRDCPACGGEGAVDTDWVKHIDLTDYEDVDCPLCKGSGRRNGGDCPECGGEGKFERRYMETVDLRIYDDVKCPVCKGKGIHRGERCAACDGEREMERRYVDQIDLRDYENVACPLCAERGEDRDCPVCDGQFEIEGRYAARIDMADYRNVNCRLCKGSGRVDHDDCLACGGEGEMERRQYDNVDWLEWDEVDCPTCNGKGQIRHDECRTCDGIGTMYRRDTWHIE
jgi:DnaJ-class molecular chaperone